MLEINQKRLIRKDNYSIITFTKQSKYYGYRAAIPNKFIIINGFSRIINLPDEQKLKIKKGDDVLIKTIKELKECER